MGRWIVVTSLSLAVGCVLAELVSAALIDNKMQGANIWLLIVVLAACVGIPVVTAQFVLLRRYLPNTDLWLVAGGLAAVGALFGGPRGYVAGIGCSAITGATNVCFQSGMFVAFVIAGAIAGMVIGSLMGVILKNDSVEWTTGWTGRLAAGWAVAGAMFWAAVPLQGWFTGGVLNSSATATSLAIAAGVGLIAGAGSGLVSGCQFVRVLRPPSPHAAPTA